MRKTWSLTLKTLLGVFIFSFPYFLLQRVGVWLGTKAFGYGPTNWGDRYVAAPIVTLLALVVVMLALAGLRLCYVVGNTVINRLRPTGDVVPRPEQ